jgi:hypothetical protein
MLVRTHLYTHEMHSHQVSEVDEQMARFKVTTGKFVQNFAA